MGTFMIRQLNMFITMHRLQLNSHVNDNNNAGCGLGTTWSIPWITVQSVVYPFTLADIRYTHTQGWVYLNAHMIKDGKTYGTVTNM